MLPTVSTVAVPTFIVLYSTGAVSLFCRTFDSFTYNKVHDLYNVSWP